MRFQMLGIAFYDSVLKVVNSLSFTLWYCELCDVTDSRMILIFLEDSSIKERKKLTNGSTIQIVHPS